MKRKTRILAAIIAVISIVSLFTGCSSKKTEAAESTESVESTPEVTTVQVGTMGTYNPFTYYDENNHLTGYDIEVVRKVEETDPTLHFEFTTGDWESLYPGLDSDKYQMLANQIAASDEKREKYYFTNYSYHECVGQIIVAGSNNDINSLSDLEGKTVGLTVGDSFFNSPIEKYNEEHGNPINVVYYQEDITTILQDIVNGRVDATVNDPTVAISKAQTQGLDVKPVGDPLATTPVYFVFKKDEAGEQLRDRVDAALKKLIDSGELSELSTQWFGTDYVPKNQ